VNRGGVALTGALTAALVLVPGVGALAEEPERTGWWSKLSAGGAALPQPTTGDGELRISNGVDGPMAFAAVLYPGLGASAAVLTLQVEPDQTLGTPDLLACVTQDAQWPAGGNQPYDAAPGYDCDAGSAFGELSPDGTTLTFLLDATQQDPSGAWSLALVPTPDGSAPFSLDLEKPAADAFVTEPASGSQEPFVSSEPDAGAGSGSGSGSGESFLPDAFPAAPPADVGSAELPPLVAGGEQAALPVTAAPAPALARTAPAGAPVLLTRPAGVAEDLGAGRRLLALLVLAGGSAAVGYAAGQQRQGPRLLGGRARVGAPAVAAAVAAGGSVEDRPRGIGRFARTRDAAPRRLR
jgi:hypothetical protein